IRADARIIAATNTDLEASVAAGRFREDLFFRLNVVRITVPPLRERRSDIPELIDFFVDKVNSTLGTSIVGITDEARQLLVAHHWPGNVGELENTLPRAAVLARGRTLLAEDFALGPPKADGTGGGELRLEDAVRRRVWELLEQDGRENAGDLY